MKKTVRTAFLFMCMFVVFVIGCRQMYQLVVWCRQQPIVYETIQESAVAGNLADVKRHLQKGAAVNAKGKDGDTPLMMAAGSGHLDVVKFLVDKGADVEAMDKNDWTPLMIAVNGSGAEQDFPKLNLKAKLKCAEYLEVVKYLVDKGADVEASVEDGSKPLSLAAMHGDLEVVKVLVAKGADVNGRGVVGSRAIYRSRSESSLGNTPLIEAARLGRLDVVKLLVDKGADVNAFIFKDGAKGATVLTVAKANGNPDVVEFLKQHGAKE